MKRIILLKLVIGISLIFFVGCNSHAEEIATLEEQVLSLEEELETLTKDLADKQDELIDKETDLEGLMGVLEEKLQAPVVGEDGVEIDRFDLEFNPNTEGFYNGVYYSGEIGLSAPGEYHTVKDAVAMGYDVILVDYNEHGDMIVEVLPMDVPGHLENNLWAYENETMTYEYTILIDPFAGLGIAVFFTETGEVVEYDVSIF